LSTENREGNQVFSPAEAQRAGFQVRDVMRDDFGFELPVESVPLPSGGVLYPVQSTMHNAKFVDIKAMTAKEEDILTSRALIKKGTVITELIKSCLVDSAVNVDEMIAGDRNAIMTAIRITGYGSEYSAEVECPDCNEKNKQDWSLLDLPVKNLEIAPVAEGANLFEHELPVTKKTVQFKFLTGKDEQEISTTMERRKKQGYKSDSLVTTRLKHSIVAVGGITDKNKLEHFIKNMPAKDSLSLRKHIDKNEPGVDMKVWLDCPGCYESSEVRLPMGANFFWPDTE
jgi:hypothetical protein